MPVISVKLAAQLRDGGSVAGKELAVAGYFNWDVHSCYSTGPVPYDLPLEPNNCVAAVFADSPEQACVKVGRNGLQCKSAISPTPVFMAGMLGGSALPTPADEPDPIVVIGHFGDSRYFQCIPTDQVSCAGQFVADSIAWADGHAVDPVVQTTVEAGSGERNVNLSFDDLLRAVAPGQAVVGAGASIASDVRLLDPRWNRAGDDVLWVVKSINGQVADGEARGVTVWLVDDATDTVIDSHPLSVPDGYSPAVVWLEGAHHGVDESQDGWNMVTAAVTVITDTGAQTWEGTIGEPATGSEDTTTNGPDVPLVLDAGTYTFSATTAMVDGSAVPPGYGDCSTSQTLAVAERIRLDVEFSLGQPCTWSVSLSPAF